jgi:hypothetical protein
VKIRQFDIYRRELKFSVSCGDQRTTTNQRLLASRYHFPSKLYRIDAKTLLGLNRLAVRFSEAPAMRQTSAVVWAYESALLLPKARKLCSTKADQFCANAYSKPRTKCLSPASTDAVPRSLLTQHELRLSSARFLRDSRCGVFFARVDRSLHCSALFRHRLFLRTGLDWSGLSREPSSRARAW